MTGAAVDPALTDIAMRYSRFADREVQGRSRLYEAFARGVAGDPSVLTFLAGLPAEKQQPNLLFAAVRILFGVALGWPAFRDTLLANTDAVRQVMLTRSTQTNEPARCATLLPVLARLPQPLALIEVGASAGLCLLPDLYAYEYGQHALHPPPSPTPPPVFRCLASPGTPLPGRLPDIAWRAGLDLNPIDAADPSETAWLEALVWPEHIGRLHNLRSALQLAAGRPPNVVKGDLLGDDLDRLCAEAPAGATRVVFHTAVLAYVSGQTVRQSFGARVRTLCDYWICNEAPRMVPDLASRAPRPGRPEQFLLSVNGEPVAWTDSHGASIDWIGPG